MIVDLNCDLGEGMEHLQVFDREAFVGSLFE